MPAVLSAAWNKWMEKGENNFVVAVVVEEQLLQLSSCQYATWSREKGGKNQSIKRKSAKLMVVEMDKMLGADACALQVPWMTDYMHKARSDGWCWKRIDRGRRGSSTVEQRKTEHSLMRGLPGEGKFESWLQRKWKPNSEESSTSGVGLSLTYKHLGTVQHGGKEA